MLKDIYFNKRFLLFLIGIILILFFSWSYEQKVFAIHFVDEEDNFTLGMYLLRGEKLYSNLFSHHQPLGYILSAALQQITDPNSIYLLVKRHREFVILWSAFWSLFLIARFGVSFLIVTFILESTKFLFLGNLFLSETLVLYPLLYLNGLILNKVKLNHFLELIFVGFCIFLILFLYAPLWPAVPVLIFLLLRNINKSKLKKSLSFIFLGLVVFIPMLLVFVDLKHYFYNVFYINFTYYIPHSNQISQQTSLLDATLAPVLAFTGPYGDGISLWLIRSLIILLLLNVVILLKQKNFYFVIILFILLTLSNLRFIRAGAEYYNGFHLLPWFGVLVTVSCLTAFNYLRQKNQFVIKLIIGVLLTFVIFFSGYIAVTKLLVKSDPGSDLYINYSQFFDSGEAIRIMKEPNETLFVAPDGWLIYWQSKIDHASPMINYYGWMTQVPILKGYVTDMFDKNKPTYFYCNCSIELGLNDYLKNYQPIKKDGKNTSLYVLLGKLDELSEDQRKKLQFLNYQTN